MVTDLLLLSGECCARLTKKQKDFIRKTINENFDSLRSPNFASMVYKEGEHPAYLMNKVHFDGLVRREIFSQLNDENSPVVA